MATMVVHVDLDAARRYWTMPNHKRRMGDFAHRQMTNRVERDLPRPEGFFEAINARSAFASHHNAASALIEDHADLVADLVSRTDDDASRFESLDPVVSPRAPRGPNSPFTSVPAIGCSS